MSRKNNSNESTFDDREAAVAALNVEPTPSPMKKSLVQGLKETYSDYCSSTSIHGVPYLSQNRPKKENFFWSCILLISIYYCTLSVLKYYGKWEDTPVIVSFSETSTDISKIPFPAITICSETKRSLNNEGPSFAELLLNLVDDGVHFKPNITSNELREFLTLLYVCGIEDLYPSIPEQSLPPIDYIKILNEMAPDIPLIACRWSGSVVPCLDLVTTAYTEEGICYTFNGLNGTDLYRESTVQYKEMGLQSSVADPNIINRTLSWSIQEGYAPDSPLNAYPARISSTGHKAGFKVLLQNVKEEVDYSCRGEVQGFKILLHSPDAVPLVSKQFVRVSHDKNVMIAIKPQMMLTTDDIAGYAPEKRHCYLDGERRLKFFKIYNQDNCELESLTNYTFTKCGCVKFSMPRTADMPVCGLNKMHCYTTVEYEMLIAKFANSVDYTDADVDTKIPHIDCMPSCSSLRYDTEISQGQLDVKKSFKLNQENDWLLQVFSSMVSIYFKDNEFITTKRSRLYSFYDLLASGGGLGGLFMGISILSVIEIFYHFSLRLWLNMTSKKNVK